MDKNSVIGLTLIAAILIGYSVFFAPDIPPPSTNTEDTTKVQSSTQTLKNLSNSNEGSDVDTVEVASYEEEVFEIENDMVAYRISSVGAKILSVRLKEFETYNKMPVVLIDEQNSDMQLLVSSALGTIDLKKLQFEGKISQKNNDVGKITELRFTRSESDGRKYVQTYELPENGYTLRYLIEGTGNGISNGMVQLNWSTNLRQLEKDLKTGRLNSTVNFYTLSKEFNSLGESNLSLTKDSITEPVKWVSLKQKFFSSGIVSDVAFSNAALTSFTNENDETMVKFLEAKMSFPSVYLTSGQAGFTYYFGPNQTDIQAAVTEGFEENVYLGWTIFATINKYTIAPLFHFLERYFDNYGVIIIILVFIVKLFLSPLSYRSYISMAKMRVLKPEIDAIKEKTGEDMQAFQQEQLQLYQKAGVNPLSGCVPVLLTMPIFLALFNFFPNSIELRQQGFLWADDLSSYDSVLDLPFTIPFYGDHVSMFTLLMTLSTLVYTWYNNQISTAATGPMKTISYLMPIMFLFFLNSFSSGLTLYYFVSNVITILQQFIISKMVDDEKLRKVIEDNRQKNVNKPKSRLMQRLEDTMKSRDNKVKPSPKNATKPTPKSTTKNDKKPGKK